MICLLNFKFEWKIVGEMVPEQPTWPAKTIYVKGG